MGAGLRRGHAGAGRQRRSDRLLHPPQVGAHVRAPVNDQPGKRRTDVDRTRQALEVKPRHVERRVRRRCGFGLVGEQFAIHENLIGEHVRPFTR